MAARYSARELLDRTLDAGSFTSWDTAPVDVGPGPEYAAELARARERSGCDESVLTGEGLLRGRRVAVLACEFSFLAGSIGVAAAERLTAAVERATAERLPLLAAPASGGTRMQEGTVAFLSMVKISTAITAHKAAGLPYLVYLRHPTTGGVLASWGSLGHVTVAEPGALIGFLGPRVYEALYGRPFPEGVQRAENLYRHGLVDAVLAPEELPGIAERAFNVLLARGEGRPAPPSAPEPAPEGPVWDSVLRSRRTDRPGVRRLLRTAATDVVPLNGTGEGEADPGLLLALARFGGAPCVLLGQDRARQSAEHPMGPAGLREARRGMRLAAELDLPLVTVIDTPGAALSKEAEEQGMAGQIARCLAELATLEAPTVAVLLGQGAGGGALALAPADRVLCARHAWLSPLPPEGASAIVHRTTERAGELAELQGIGSAALLAAGVVDRIVAERGDAADEPEAFCLRMGEAIARELVALPALGAAERLAARTARYRGLGLPG
ncbi:carboxyl transferase domain-containing protein [Nocardiopsis potens]|uniref:carboxyl transferase domain-containing protein n=1 Tax=Nocardiopsis potens TaxID=1246458 RepID=UPI000348D36F|nr:carboxyl transferase domain-containing protein [Nocardiopsis potens]